MTSPGCKDDEISFIVYGNLDDLANELHRRGMGRYDEHGVFRMTTECEITRVSADGPDPSEDPATWGVHVKPHQ